MSVTNSSSHMGCDISNKAAQAASNATMAWVLSDVFIFRPRGQDDDLITNG